LKIAQRKLHNHENSLKEQRKLCNCAQYAQTPSSVVLLIFVLLFT